MTVMLNESANNAVAGLYAAMRAAGFPEAEIDGISRIASVGDREELAVAASLCGSIAALFAGVDPRCEEAARHAYFVFSDQANVQRTNCLPCSMSLHLEHTHSVEARLNSDAGLGSADLCGCYCQRRK